jgi:RNA polymerase sigma-70 factor (ECF subfamily)
MYKNEKELIRLCLQDDKKAQRKLVDQYGPPIFGYIKFYLNDPVEAQDILQEVFIAAFKSLPDFHGDCLIYHWLKVIAKNKLYRHVKTKWKSSVDMKEPNSFPDSSIDETILSTINKNEILAEVDKLPEINRVAFLMHVVEGYSHQDIASILGITEEASRSRLFKAKKILQESLKIYQ